MRTIVASLNAKYIHTSLALRLLYVANKDRIDISFREYSIKENVAQICQDLVAQSCNVLGLGVYIWNVRQTELLVRMLKDAQPDLIVVLGGPEVSYEPDFFINNWPIDYVVSGEGEFVFGDLVLALEQGCEVVELQGVSSRISISNTVAQSDLNRLAALDSPYMLPYDVEQRKHKLIYFESTRGCPYQCQYCLSSLEKGVRYFPQVYLENNLRYLIEHGVKNIKFLDRTFNLHKERSLQLFNFLIQNHRPGLSCQFEIYADLLNEDIIAYLNTHVPEGFFRFEIGIQSTYEPTNLAVQRKQNFALVEMNISMLMEGGRIDLHLDLIAGLPHETFERFVQSFNQVFALGAKEVQLGFLKMLRGTALRKQAHRYSYEYRQEAPFEVLSNDAISQQELQIIHEAEHALERYWNSGRFSQTMHHLFTTSYKGRYFELFDEIAQYCQQKGLAHHGYQLEDLFRLLHEFLLTKGMDLTDVLRADYYGNFIIRPTGTWLPSMDRKELKQWRYHIGQDKDFLAQHGLSRTIIEKQTAIDRIDVHTLLLTVFVNKAHEPRLSVRYHH